MKSSTPIAMLVGLVILSLLPLFAFAQDCNQLVLTWDAPTERLDGSLLPASEIGSYLILIRNAQTGEIKTIPDVAADSTQISTGILGCDSGNYEITVATVDTNDFVGEGLTITENLQFVPAVTTPNYPAAPSSAAAELAQQLLMETVCDSTTTEISARVTCTQEQ